LQLGDDLHHDAYVPAIGEAGRDLTLSKCVVERVVDLRGADPEAGGRVAIDDHPELEPGGLLIGDDILHVWHLPQALHELGCPGQELLEIGRL
jgi:hypothetical protein